MRSTHKLPFLFVALSITAVSCGSPQNPGDECNIKEDNCPETLVCGAFEDKNVCQIPPGGACDLEADKSYCLEGVCEDDGTNTKTGVCIRHIAEGGVCNPDNTEFEKCDDGLTCAEVTAGYKCFPPVLLKGRVFDSATDAGIPDGHVIALDEVATAVTDVAITDMAGNYQLEVPVLRDDMGIPVKNRAFTLRADAQGYQTFPGGLRTALPISTGEAKLVNKVYEIKAALTDIALIALPADQQGLPSISGVEPSQAVAQLQD